MYLTYQHGAFHGSAALVHASNPLLCTAMFGLGGDAPAHLRVIQSPTSLIRNYFGDEATCWAVHGSCRLTGERLHEEKKQIGDQQYSFAAVGRATCVLACCCGGCYCLRLSTSSFAHQAVGPGQEIGDAEFEWNRPCPKTACNPDLE
jgi:hypothetical protein